MTDWTQADIDAVHATAAARYLYAVRDGRDDAAGASSDPATGFGYHLLGCWGEQAIAKELGIPWPRSVNQFDPHIPDVGIFHVRTRSKHHYQLIIRPTDTNASFPYVLVTTENPPHDIEIHGWIYRYDATREAWWKTHGNRPGAWFVPHYELSMPL